MCIRGRGVGVWGGCLGLGVVFQVAFLVLQAGFVFFKLVGMGLSGINARPTCCYGVCSLSCLRGRETDARRFSHWPALVCGASVFGKGAFFLHDKLTVFALGDALLRGIQRCLTPLHRKGREQFLGVGIETRRYADALVGVVKDLAGAAAFAVARLQGHLSGSLL